MQDTWRVAEDYYAVLGVSPQAGLVEIEEAYRRLAKRYHPDVSRDSQAHERIREINVAHQVLARPERRAAYDRWRARAPGRRTARAAAAGEHVRPPAAGAPTSRASTTRTASVRPTVRVTPGALHYGRLDRGRPLTRSITLASEDERAIDVHVLPHGDWLTVARRETSGPTETLVVTADAGHLEHFWAGAGPSVALLSGWLEIVVGSISLRVNASAVLRRDQIEVPRVDAYWWPRSTRQAGGGRLA
jgi:hypothetical protein